jgi:hypothetical protein
MLLVHIVIYIIQTLALRGASPLGGAARALRRRRVHDVRAQQVLDPRSHQRALVQQAARAVPVHQRRARTRRHARRHLGAHAPLVKDRVAARQRVCSAAGADAAAAAAAAAAGSAASAAACMDAGAAGRGAAVEVHEQGVLAVGARVGVRHALVDVLAEAL